MLTPEERKARRRESDKRWREANADKVRAADALRRERDREKRNAANRAYYVEHRDESLARTAAWIKAHPEARAAMRHRRYARLAGVESEDFTDTELLNLYGSDCHICHEAIDLAAPRRSGVPGWERGLHREHVVPLAKGGPNTLANSRPAHGLCNLRKAAKV